jgi:hypothetical protein
MKPVSDDETRAFINEATQSPPEEPRDAELMRRATDIIGQLTLRMENQREELKLLKDTILRQQALLQRHGIVP